jgi:hypothetical protein
LTKLTLARGQSPADLLKQVTKQGRGTGRSKYGAVRTSGYASKKEAEYAQLLERKKRSGLILDYLEQVPIWLPGRIRYVLDFMVLELDGSVRFVEVKGHENRVWKNKVKQLQELRPALYNRLEIVR